MGPAAKWLRAAIRIDRATIAALIVLATALAPKSWAQNDFFVARPHKPAAVSSCRNVRTVTRPSEPGASVDAPSQTIVQLKWVFGDASSLRRPVAVVAVGSAHAISTARQISRRRRFPTRTPQLASAHSRARRAPTDQPRSRLGWIACAGSKVRLNGFAAFWLPTYRNTSRSALAAFPESPNAYGRATAFN